MAHPPKKPTEKPAVNDPMEGAKLFAPPPPPPTPPPGPPAIIHAPTGETEPEVKLKPSYKVKETTTLSVSGTLIRLNKDDIISERHYGADAYSKIVGSNVALIKLDE